LLRGLSEELELKLTEAELDRIVSTDWPKSISDFDQAALKQHIENRPQLL